MSASRRPAARDSFASLRARLEAVGFHPSSALGQNFLLDPSLHRWIAEAAGIEPADTVVEIGSGLGFLTRELAARAARVLAVEVDARLLAVAREDLAAAANVTWVLADALGGAGRTLHPDVAAALAAGSAAAGRVLVVANLPYAISGPLLVALAAAACPPSRCVLLVQKEVAQRIAALPGSRDYGGLSAALQALFRVRVLRDVPPEVFRPRPKVRSAILELARRDDGPMAGAPAAARRQFLAFVRRLFGQRRKALRTTLPAAAQAIGRRPPILDAVELGQRAEQVPPDTLAQWWQACLADRTGGSRSD